MLKTQLIFTLQQLAFDFPFVEKYLIDDFIVSDCNQKAFNFITNYQPAESKEFPRIFALNAPKSSGKTYLSNIWAEKFDAEFINIKNIENINLLNFIAKKKFYILEDIRKVRDENLVLQIINLVEEKLSYLMITSDINLNKIDCNIKDLSSRLKNIFHIMIDKIDDDLIYFLLAKNFSEKQLDVDKKVISFLVKNIRRNFSSVIDVARLLEFQSLERKRKITIPLAKEVIKMIEKIDKKYD